VKRIATLALACFLLAAWPFCYPLPTETKFFGYFENRFFLLNQASGSDGNGQFKIGDYNRLRLMAEMAPSEKVNLNIAVDLFTFHGIVQSPLGVTVDGQTPAANETDRIDLDRAYVDFYLKKLDITVGKQRVALGVSYIWAPLDIFNRVNLFEPKEEKPGATAVKVYWPVSGKTSLTGVFAPESDFRTSKSALRAQTQAGTVDIGLTLMRWGTLNETIYGIDLRGENFIGWWLEGGKFVSPASTFYKFVAGFDYTFPVRTGLYWLGEFFYDSSGTPDPLQYDFQKLVDSERFTLGRAYFFSLLRYAFSEFLSASVAYIGNWQDGSFLINPSLSYDLTQSLNLSAGLYLPAGGARGEFSQRRQNVFFLWLKMNF